MIDLAYTEEQDLFRRAVRDFAAQEIAPIAQECDERAIYPRELFPKVGALGYLGITFPPEYGGSGGDNISYTILSEELSYASAGIALGIYVHVALALTAMAIFGTAEQKARYLAPGIRGQLIGAWGFAEPSAGSDPGSMQTRAVRDGDTYVINGSKHFITNGTFADFIVLSTITDPTKGMKGMSLLIVDRDAPGFSVGRKIATMGMRAAETAELHFEDCRVPAANLLGEEHQGFLSAMNTLTLGRVMAASFALGVARAAFDAALAYAKQRHQFGQPIGKFQGLQWMFADMATELEAARLLTLNAAWRAEQGLPHIKEASMAKLFATELCTRITNQALQIHGAYGYVMESPIQRYYRDCKVFEIGEGTSQIQRNVIARQLGL